MASYRYERGIDPKDLKPRKQRQYSRKERWANWWDYNLKWVLIFGIAGAFVAYCFIGQYFLTTHPDYNVAVVSPYYLPEATVTALQEQLAAYGEGCNGDSQQLLADYYIGIRGAWLKESASLLENSEPLWANLTAGAVSTAGEGH